MDQTALIVIESDQIMPYGMLHNNFKYSMTIDGKEYANVSEYLYINLFRFLLYKYKEKLKLLKLKGLMWVDMCMSNPETCDFIKQFLKDEESKKSIYEKFEESVDNFRRQIMSHHYTKILSEKLLSDDKLLSKFLMLKEEIFVYRDDDKLLGMNKNNEGENMIGLILRNIHNLFESQNMFVLIFKPYIVYCILKYYLTVEMNDFQLLKSYVDLGRIISTSKGEIDLLHKIIDEFKAGHNIKNLKTFNFESDIENKEFRCILIASIKDPIILIEYTINKYFNILLSRMNEFRKKIIFNVYVQKTYPSNYSEIQKELRSLNVSKISDIILSLYSSDRLPEEIKDSIDMELGRYVFVSNFSKIFSEEILKENSDETNDKERKKVYEFDRGVKFITESISKLKELFEFFSYDLDSVKELLLRIGLCKKFGHNFEQINIEFFKSHKIIIREETRHLKDLQHLLKTIENLIVTYRDKDEFVSKFMGNYLKILSSKTQMVEKYEWKEKLNEFVEQDLFMSNWLMRTVKYVINFINIVYNYVNDEQNVLKKIQDILVCLGGSKEFLVSKQKAPLFFHSLVEKDMKRIIKKDNLKVINLIWNFVMYNVIVLYNNRSEFFGRNYQSEIKHLLLFFYLKLQKEPNCIIEYTEENKEYNLLSCIVDASFNVHKILSTYLNLKIRDNEKQILIASIILNRKIVSKDKVKIKKRDDLEEEEETQVIQNIIESNSLEGLSVHQIKDIIRKIKGEKIPNNLINAGIAFWMS